MPSTRAQLEGLAERATVVRYDPRGGGMSQRDAVDFSPEAMVLDLDAVVDRLGLERFALLGRGPSGNIPFVYAARRPERVSHLVLVWARGTRSTGREEQVAAILPLMEEHWELFTNILARLVLDWDSPDATPLASQFRGAHSSPQSFRLAREAMLASTPEAFAHDIKAPTLIMHRLGDSVTAETARTLAAQITGAQVAGIPGLPDIGLNAVGIAALHDFISTKPAAPGQPIAVPELDTSAIKTILFTDIEAHTSMMQRLGDAKGRDVLREHERISREALCAYGGTEIKTIGDSFMASFSSAQKALECAVALQRAFASTDAAGERLRVRVGINAGEPIAEEDDLFGSSVILAARAARQAQGGEILVTDVVRQLVTGKGFLFADRGEIELRGFEDPVRLYEVRWRKSEG